jgi:hypothetical protein
MLNGKSRVGDNRVDVRLGVEHQHEGLLLIDIFAPLRSDTSGQSRRDPHVSVLSGAISRGFCLCPGVPPRIARSPLPHPHSIVLDGFSANGSGAWLIWCAAAESAPWNFARSPATFERLGADYTVTLKVAFNERSDVGAGVRRNLVQAIDTDVQSAAKDQALQKSCVLREAFQFFLDTFEYALVAEQPQTFPRKLPIGAEQKIIGAPAL